MAFDRFAKDGRGLREERLPQCDRRGAFACDDLARSLDERPDVVAPHADRVREGVVARFARVDDEPCDLLDLRRAVDF